jgi:hypothetical protein
MHLLGYARDQPVFYVIPAYHFYETERSLLKLTFHRLQATCRDSIALSEAEITVRHIALGGEKDSRKMSDWVPQHEK